LAARDELKTRIDEFVDVALRGMRSDWRFRTPGLAQLSWMDGDLGHLQGNNLIIIKICLPEIQMSKPGGRGNHNAAFARD
jgi:hypothetical protein